MISINRIMKYIVCILPIILTSYIRHSNQPCKINKNVKYLTTPNLRTLNIPPGIKLSTKNEKFFIPLIKKPGKLGKKLNICPPLNNICPSSNEK